MTKQKVILIIRDGWGSCDHTHGNVVHKSKTPITDDLMKNYPNTLLGAHGNSVGLPEGTQGGSEPGHLTIGAGRVVWQPFEDINRKIKNAEFFENPALLQAIDNCKKNDSSLHLMGLFSDQGIHGTTEHLYALMKLAKQNGIDKVYIHCFLDGRDVPEKSAKVFLEEFKKRQSEIGVGKIASLQGRYYSMDRDTNYDRTKQAYELMTTGKGIIEKNYFKAIDNAYSSGVETDYYIKPTVIVDENNVPISIIKDGDSVIFWNFRSDRTRQLTYAFTNNDFTDFERDEKLDITFVCMSRYDENLDLPVAFEQTSVKNNLGQVISDNGLKQLRISETEKYAHVTFFFNSQQEEKYEGEDRIMIPSPKVANYSQKPEMSAIEVTNKVVEQVNLGKYDFIVVNLANCDLVGHSGDIEACIVACEVVDECVGRITKAGLANDYCLLITADHGNVECMYYENGETNPSHGTNPVSLICVSDKLKNIKLNNGGLDDIAPTILDIMSIPKPKEMTGESLLYK